MLLHEGGSEVHWHVQYIQYKNMATDDGVQYESGDSDSEDVEDWYG